MPDLVLLSLAVAGLAISAFATVLLLSAFRLVGRFFSITAVYLLFTLTFLAAILGSFYGWVYLFAALFEVAALFLVFYQNLRREFLSSAAGLTGVVFAPAEAIAYVLALYFLVYSSIVIVRERRRAPDSRYVFAAFLVLVASVLFAILSIMGVGSFSAALAYGLLDVGVVLFFLPLFRLRHALTP
ncbi:MAG TPA: hypothetical protein VMV28_06680 [Thermoplasmata archaeon]|nr:hypothetical protein [Thermoplasmata archaeon]